MWPETNARWRASDQLPFNFRTSLEAKKLVDTSSHFAGMQDPARELPGLINALLQSPAGRQRELIERYYEPDCKLTHALVRGRERAAALQLLCSSARVL